MKPTPRPVLRVRRAPTPTPAHMASFCLDPKADLSALPRSLRLAVRKEWFHAKPAEPDRTHTDLPQAVDIAMEEFRYGPNDDPGYCLNTVDPDFDIDGSEEFNDSRGDEDLSGLTIVEPGHGNVRRWLRGYDVI